MQSILFPSSARCVESSWHAQRQIMSLPNWLSRMNPNHGGVIRPARAKQDRMCEACVPPHHLLGLLVFIQEVVVLSDNLAAIVSRACGRSLHVCQLRLQSGDVVSEGAAVLALAVQLRTHVMHDPLCLWVLQSRVNQSRSRHIFKSGLWGSRPSCPTRRYTSIEATQQSAISRLFYSAMQCTPSRQNIPA